MIQFHKDLFYWNNKEKRIPISPYALTRPWWPTLELFCRWAQLIRRNSSMLFHDRVLPDDPVFLLHVNIWRTRPYQTVLGVFAIVCKDMVEYWDSRNEIHRIYFVLYFNNMCELCASGRWSAKRHGCLVHYEDGALFGKSERLWRN